MAPQKRKASAKTTTPPNKKTRVEQESGPAQPSRPKRKTVGKPQYNFTRSHKQANHDLEADSVATEPEASTLKRRGRPPKDKSTEPKRPSSAKSVGTGKPRGRPKSNKISQDLVAEKVATKAVKATSTGQKRGRPRKATSLDNMNQVVEAKSLTKATKASKPQAPAEGTDAPRKRGRPPKKIRSIVSLSDVYPDTDSGTDTFGAEATDEDHGDRQYWLMKAEPNDRYENGVNVKFSIDDLAAAEVPEPWDGKNFTSNKRVTFTPPSDLLYPLLLLSCAVH